MSLRSYAAGSLLVFSLFSCSRLASAADPPMPRSIVVPLRPPASWFASPPPSPLNAAETCNIQLWMNVAVHKNPDLLPIIVKLDALLHHPANAGRVRNVDEARDILAGAIRALRYERGEVAPALSSQFFEGFKLPLPRISEPREMNPLLDKGMSTVQKALEKRIPSLKEWFPLLPYITLADKFGGQNHVRTLYETNFSQKKKLLDDAWQRARPDPRTPFIDDRALREAVARLRTAKPGTIAYELMKDAGPLSLQAPPMKPEGELRLDPRYKDELLALNAAPKAPEKPVSAANRPHLPATNILAGMVLRVPGRKKSENKASKLGTLSTCPATRKSSQRNSRG